MEYLPSPLDIPPVNGVNPSSQKTEERPARDDAPFSALAFKIMTDPFVGTLSFFRVYSGALTSGSSVYNSTRGKRERIGRLLKMHANKREEIKEVYAGDIAAAVGSRPRLPVIPYAMRTPDHSGINDFPIRSSLSPSGKEQDTKKDRPSLQKLTTEDPFVQSSHRRKPARRLSRVWSELHRKSSSMSAARIQCRRQCWQARVAYKETIRKNG